MLRTFSGKGRHIPLQCPLQRQHLVPLEHRPCCLVRGIGTPFCCLIQHVLLNLNPGGAWPAAWYPWDAGYLKELKKEVAEHGPNYPWAKSILQGLAHHSCTTKDWKSLCKAVYCLITYTSSDVSSLRRSVMLRQIKSSRPASRPSFLWATLRDCRPVKNWS